VSATTYSQYPRTKKIGNDSVVIMTVEQGNYINALIKGYKSQIDSLSIDNQLNKVFIDSLTHRVDSLKSRQDSLKTVISDVSQYKWKYEANREIFFKAEKEERFRTKMHELGKFLLVAVVVLQFVTIASLK
jgi:hypothetical protein